MASHYLKQCWPSLSTYICGTRGDELSKYCAMNDEEKHLHTNKYYEEPLQNLYRMYRGVLIDMSLFINSLAPGKFESNFRYLILQIISVIDGWGISCELALRWMSLDLNDDQSTLAQIMAWCRQATSHYLSQCWARSLSPYGITRPQCVKTLWTSEKWDRRGHLGPLLLTWFNFNPSMDK